MNNLAISYSDLGPSQEAMELRKKLLKALHRVLGSEDPDSLDALDNHAISYGNLGRSQEAVELREKMLGARPRMLGSEHPNIPSARKGRTH